MPLVRSRAPVIDTSQEPRREPIIIWVDEPVRPTLAERFTSASIYALVAGTSLYFGWQLLVRP